MLSSVGAHPSERAIIGTLMAGNHGELLCLMPLEPEDFLDERHANTLRLLRARWKRGDNIGTRDVCASLEEADVTEYGGVPYVRGHTDYADDAAAYQRHVKQIKDRRNRVNLLRGIHGCYNGLKNQKSSVPETMASMVSLLGETGAAIDRSVAEMIALLDDKYDEEERGLSEVYIPTGIPAWDNHSLFGGSSNQGMSIFMGASGSGKTTVLNCLALGLCRSGKQVYLHGSETSVERRLRDLTFSLAGVDQRAWAWHCRGLTLLKEQGEPVEELEQEVSAMRQRLSRSSKEIGRYGLHMTGAGLTVERVCAEAYRMERQGRCDAIIVDYLQDLVDSTGPGRRLGDSVQQVGHKSSTLKELAADLGVPVLVGAQVSGEKAGPGQDPRPHHWQVQSSSKAHQDAEEIFAIYRDDLYAERIPDWKRRGEAGMMEIISRKKRVGKLGVLSVSFDGPTKWIGSRWFSPA